MKSGFGLKSSRLLDPCMLITKSFKKISISVKFDPIFEFFSGIYKLGNSAMSSRNLSADCVRPVIAGPVIVVAQWNWNWTVAAAKGVFKV